MSNGKDKVAIASNHSAWPALLVASVLTIALFITATYLLLEEEKINLGF
jgi:hypothetical protein